MLWDLYQHYQIEQLESRVDRVQTATAEDSGARRASQHLEERVDRLVLLCRAMFELLQESTGHTDERLSAKILETICAMVRPTAGCRRVPNDAPSATR
jgi:hypothetical protein